MVRLLGGKQQLFTEVYSRASRRVVAALAAVAPGPDAKQEMGDAYVGLLADWNLLLLLMHGAVDRWSPALATVVSSQTSLQSRQVVL